METSLSNDANISRPWIITALSLLFNDALTYREIAEQLNVRSSATHKMFKRFRRTGINWPLPRKYTSERLEEELYAFNLETNLPVKNLRPEWPLEFNFRMAKLSLQPAACVAVLAREYGVNDKMVFNWRNLYRQGTAESCQQSHSRLIIVTRNITWS